jgi:cytochrome P450
LRAHPEDLPKATEEILRRYTFTVPPRIVAQDQEFEGVTMKKGERAFLFLPGADLDPDKFSAPATYDFERESNAHVAFGAGAHRCVGAHLARMELQVFYEEFLARIPRFSLDADRPVEYQSGHVIGPAALHLNWQAN